MFPTIDKRKTGVHLRKIMSERGITVKDVQQYLGLGTVQSVYHWMNGISMPSIDNLYALSDFFGLPIDELVCGNRPPMATTKVSREDIRREQRLYEYYKRLVA